MRTLSLGVTEASGEVRFALQCVSVSRAHWERECSASLLTAVLPRVFVLFALCLCVF